MSRWTEQDLQRVLSDRGKARQDAATPKPSKYRNVKVMIDGEKFDSKREAAEWQRLRLRERAGEIFHLRRQVPIDLQCPDPESPVGDVGALTVAVFVADFVYRDTADAKEHVIDVKGGKETAMFTLKRKWLFLQSGIEIEVVR